MEENQILIVLAVYLVAGFVKGFAGLGFSAVSIGILASFLDLTIAIPLVAFPSIASSLLVMADAGQFREALGKFSTMYLASLPGLAVGIWLLVAPEGNIAKLVLGILLAVYGIWGLINPTYTLSEAVGRRLRAPTGLLTGVLSGLTGVAVMPVAPYLLSLGIRRDLFVQSLNISFVISSVIVVASLGGLGFISWSTLGIAIGAIPPVALAVKAGVLLRRRVSEQQFRVGVLLVLVGLGVNLIAFA